LTNDSVVGLTSVAFGGALVVSNVGPDSLAPGDTFPLFSTGGSGNFSSITPALSGQMYWSFSPATGVLSVLGPPTISYSNSGSSIQLSWTAAGFKLQAQTNSIDVGLSNNWADFPGGGSSPVSVQFDPAQGTVFFRLVPLP